MKKLALAICLLVVSIAAQAQFEKGKMILNPSVTGLDFSYSKNDKAKFGVGAQVGYGLVVFLQLGGHGHAAAKILGGHGKHAAEQVAKVVGKVGVDAPHKGIVAKAGV